eukprot:scaffold31941_cov63-Phaeocystis_antarctica.AAC.4
MEAKQPVCKLHEHLHLYPEADKLQRRARVELRRELSEQRHKHPERTLLVAIEQQEQRRSHEIHGLHVANLRIIDCPGAEHALELGEVRRFIEVWGIRLEEVGARSPNVLADVRALTVVDLQLGGAAEAFIRGGRRVLSLPPPRELAPPGRKHWKRLVQASGRQHLPLLRHRLAASYESALLKLGVHSQPTTYPEQIIGANYSRAPANSPRPATQSQTARHTSSGLSSCGQWPLSGSSRSEAVGMLAASRRELESGTSLSFAPWMISTGSPSACSASHSGGSAAAVPVAAVAAAVPVAAVPVPVPPPPCPWPPRARSTAPPLFSAARPGSSSCARTKRSRPSLEPLTCTGQRYLSTMLGASFFGSP